MGYALGKPGIYSGFSPRSAFGEIDARGSGLVVAPASGEGTGADFRDRYDLVFHAGASSGIGATGGVLFGSSSGGSSTSLFARGPCLAMQGCPR
jgi:hypothetical protein